MKILQYRCSRFFAILFAKHSIYNLSDNYRNQIRVKGNHFPKPTVFYLVFRLIVMTILLLDFFMVLLQLDIWNFIQHLKCPNVFVYNFQEQTQHDDNDSSWECCFVIGWLYDFGNVHFNTMWNQTRRKVASCAAVFSVAPTLSPHKCLCGESVGATLKTAVQEARRKATYSILLFTQAPHFICGTKMTFDQMNLEVLFPAIAIWSEHKAVLFLWLVDSFYLYKPVSSSMGNPKCLFM